MGFNSAFKGLNKLAFMCLELETFSLYYCFTLLLLSYYSATTNFVLLFHYDTARDLSDPTDGVQEHNFSLL